MMVRIFTSLVFSVAAVSSGYGAMVGTSHMTGSNNWFTIDQEFEASFPPSRDYTGFIFEPAGSSFEYLGSFLDEGASVYLVEADDVFAEGSILGGDFVELNFGEVYTFGTHFFLGIRTPFDGQEFNGFIPAYGWAEVLNLGTGELVLIDHAVAYDSRGIIVDTLVAVPEPSFPAVFGLAGIGGLMVRRRMNSLEQSTAA